MTTMERSAVISDDGLYRYRLTRTWALGPRVTFVMLNPSTADADVDDPTLRRCMGFASSWGFGGLDVVNLYAYRTPSPNVLRSAGYPVGPENERYLREAGESGDLLIAAWGGNAQDSRVREVLALPGFERLRCLKVTKHGQPSHPLFLRKDLQPVPWQAL